MDLSVLSSPASEYNEPRTGGRFTVRSANSPSYCLTRRPGVRKPKGLSEEEREGNEDIKERVRYRPHTCTNDTHKEDAGSSAARTGSHSSVKGQPEEKETSGRKTSTRLNQNGSAGKAITEFGADRSGNCNPASESWDRADFRSYDLPSRSKSVDWRTRERSPDWSKRADTFTLSTKEQAGGLNDRGRGGDDLRSRRMSSVTGVSSNALEKNSLGKTGQTLDRTSWGHSLPSRFRSLSGSSTDTRETATSIGPKGGQSILERIEKLYGSAGLGKTEDCSRIREFSSSEEPDHKDTVLSSPQQRLYDRATGGTFPRRFSSGEKVSPDPAQTRKSLTWAQKDSSGPESYLPPGTSRTADRQSNRQWQRQTDSEHVEEGGVRNSKWFEVMGTRSLDRARSRNTVAAWIRSERAAGEITASPQTNAGLGEQRSADWSARKERSEGKDSGRVNYTEEKDKPDGIKRTLREIPGWQNDKRDDGGKERVESRSSCSDDVFESNPPKRRVKTPERKKFPEMLPVASAASVRNKISQYEALSQRSQGLATGQMPRRAFSVPTQLGKGAKQIGGLRDKWGGLRVDEEAGEKSEGKATGAGEKFGSERSLSVDEVRVRSGRTARDGSVAFEKAGETDKKTSVERFDRYSRLKTTLEIPLNEETQRRHPQFYLDETDFSKASSPDEENKRSPSSLPSSSASTPTCYNVQKIILSPVSDDDKTPTNTPNQSPFLSPSARPKSPDEEELPTVPTEATSTPSSSLPSSSHHILADLISLDTPPGDRKKRGLDLDAWVAGSSSAIPVWDDDEEDDRDDDDSTQRDDDSNYDSDSGESSVTITSNMSQSDRKSFCVSLSDLCNFAGVEYESENDSDEWQPSGRRTASLSSEMSAFSCVSVLPSEELDRLLEDVRGLGDNNLQDYNDVQVVVLHKEVGVGLGFSVAGGVDQNKPVTVHKVFHSGVAAQEGSIREGDQVLSINGTSLCNFVHCEALRALKRAKSRDLGVVVLRRGGTNSNSKGERQTGKPGPSQTPSTETGQRVCVHLEKKSRDLGFSLEGGVGSSPEDKPLTVQKIFQGGPVDKVRPGDEVLEINGVSMVEKRRIEAWTLIKQLPPGPVDVVLRRPL